MGEGSEQTSSFSRVSVSRVSAALRECRFPLDPDDDDQAGHPRLLVSHGLNLKNHALYDISKNQHVDLDIPELISKLVFFTSYSNWLVLIDLYNDLRHPIHDCGCCLLNITSGQRIRIPHKWIKNYGIECVLCGPPTEPDCHLIIRNNNNLYYCRLGDDSFIDIEAERYNNKTVSTAASFGRKTYLLMENSLFELVFHGDRKPSVECGEELEFVPVVRVAAEELCTWPVKPSATKDFIVKSVECGEILVVRALVQRYTDLFENVAYFRVFRIIMGKGNKECVEELKSIGDRALFLGKNGSTTCRADMSSGVKRNSIYYYWDEWDLYVYDLEDRSTTLLRPCPVKGPLFFLCWV
ncbi:hypothetical protein STAS_29924 [Striga asiatica]|uniref:KIB1-4 beta-propeller domain-containing protein n=1 Tax=Striga asiatica TaxID=4170 RepID=A0A5A7R3W2_STRAF|nr:hypothetical protein STAS_29924 [Striga asiatica]